MKKLCSLICLSLTLSTMAARAEVKTGDIIFNGNNPYHYYGDLDSTEKLSEINKKCEARGQRLPTASEMAKIVGSAIGFRVEEVDLTVQPQWWQVWQSAYEITPAEYLSKRGLEWSQIYLLEENGEKISLLVGGDFIGKANPVGESFSNRVRYLLNYVSNSSRIRGLAPDVFLTKSQLVSRDLGFVALSPEISSDDFTTVGIGTSVFGDGGSPDMAAYIFISKLSLLEPETKRFWTNPKPLTEHRDNENKFPRRSGAPDDNPNLRILIQCVL